ncbi:MAG: cbb3-type cytochrome c oxidase subunit I [Verrucomicrobiota bacterium]
MNALASLYTQEDPYATKETRERVALSEIDRSIRPAALFFLASSVLWLMIGTVLALVASFSLHSPYLLPQPWMPNWLVEALTFGVARSAHLNAMAYGWATQAGFAVALWMMARLCRAPVRHGGLLFIAGIFWNIGVTIGVFGILAGDMTSVEWLEMPTYAVPLLAFSYAMIGVWGVMAFRFRRTRHVYVTQWYLLGALFWFPWLYIVAQTMILWIPARGTVQSITNWWFAHNVLGLWLTPIGVGAAYYLIPKVLGRPIHSYYLSLLGFWSLALFYNWAGVHHLIGGPIPVWLQSAGIVGSVMMVIPVIVTAINHHLTVVGSFADVWRSPTLRFVVFGAMSYTLVSLVGSTMALRDINVVTHFTHFTVGHAHHGVYAFFTMVMFGAIYFMMPRFLYREWPSALLIHLHFWCVAIGIGIMLVGLHIGGWVQGMQMNALDENGTPVYTFIETVRATVPWLMSRSVSGSLLMLGHIFFGINFFWMLLQARKAAAEQKDHEPTLFGRPRGAGEGAGE